MSTALEQARQALKDAENAEKYTTEMLAEAIEKVVGTVRMSVFRNDPKLSICLTYYRSVELAQHVKPREGKGYITFTADVIHACCWPKRSPSLAIRKNDEQQHNDVFDILQAPLVDLSVFKDLLKSGPALIKMFLARMATACADTLPQPWEEAPAEQIDLDFPHFTLVGGQAAILGNSPYTLPGHQYLVTPESLAFAQRKVDEEHNNLSRTTPFLESCDTRYFEEKLRTLKALQYDIDISRLAIEES